MKEKILKTLDKWRETPVNNPELALLIEKALTETKTEFHISPNQLRIDDPDRHIL